MTLEEIVAETRRRAVLFEGLGRGIAVIRGDDRVRWLDGMISADVNALEARGEGAGCARSQSARAVIWVVVS